MKKLLFIFTLIVALPLVAMQQAPQKKEIMKLMLILKAYEAGSTPFENYSLEQQAAIKKAQMLKATFDQMKEQKAGQQNI